MNTNGGYMIKKMIQHGNDAAVIIDKPLMEQLDFDIDTPLELTINGKNLIISPVKERDRRRKLQHSMDKINNKHNKTFEKLAQ